MDVAQEQKRLEAQGSQPYVAQNSASLPGAAAPVPVATVAPTAAVSTQQVNPTPIHSKRGLVEAYILGIALGWFGAHHFYLRRPGWGALYLLTFGLFGIGYVVDIFRMPFLVRRANILRAMPPKTAEKRTLDNAYVLWFPLGFFGAHHFYLRQWGWAVGYLLTFGLFGMGWFMDGICMYRMVRDFNERTKEKKDWVDTVTGNPQLVAPEPKAPKTVSDAYRLCLFPVTGLLGAHHYYLGRIAFGLFYTFTLGGLGLGWFIDWFRLWALVNDANKRIKNGTGFKERRLDDCYIIAIPAGLFGAHHFYLRRVGWGFLYFFTIGCFGIGWLVDLVRMYYIVKQHKEDMATMRRQLESGNLSGHTNPAVISQDGMLVGPGPDGQPRYVTVLPSGVHPVPGATMLTQGTYLITPAPQYSVVPGVQPPVLPQIPPGYEQASGYTSWSTIESSDVDQPPSYDCSINAPPTVHNLANYTAPPAFDAPPAVHNQGNYTPPPGFNAAPAVHNQGKDTKPPEK